jgi:hypothetical protein
LFLSLLLLSPNQICWIRVDHRAPRSILQEPGGRHGVATPSAAALPVILDRTRLVSPAPVLLHLIRSRFCLPPSQCWLRTPRKKQHHYKDLVTVLLDQYCRNLYELINVASFKFKEENNICANILLSGWVDHCLWSALSRSNKSDDRNLITWALRRVPLEYADCNESDGEVCTVEAILQHLVGSLHKFCLQHQLKLCFVLWYLSTHQIAD